MKKIILIFILLLCTSCKDYVEINDFAIISGIILDYKDNQIEMTSELIINEETTKIKTINTKGKTIDECLSKISNESNKDIFISHLKVLILTDNIIENNINIYDYFLRSSKSKMNFKIYVIEPTIKDKLFEIIKDESTSLYIDKMMTYNNKIYSSSNSLSFIDLVYKLKEPGLDPLYPSLTVDNEQIKLDSLIFFKDKKIKLTQEETIYFNILTNNIEKTILNLKCDNKEYSILTKEIKTNKNYDKNTNKFTYKINVIASINNYECSYDLDKKETIDNLNKLSSNQIKEKIQNIINIQNDNNYDFLGIENYISKHSKNRKTNSINIEINTQINSIGEMRR